MTADTDRTMTLPDQSQAAAFLRDWARRAAEEGIDGQAFLAAAQQQFRALAEQGIEQDGRTLTRLQKSLADLGPEDLQHHLELIAWTIETVKPHKSD
jgi:hypothetical protein